MRGPGRSPRRLLASLALTMLGFVAWFDGPPFLDNPGRAWHNLTANPGGILFFNAAAFAVYGLPAWLVLDLVLRAIGRARAGRRPR